MGVHIDIRYDQQAAVVSLAGAADITGLSMWAEMLSEAAAAAETVVVDLDRAELADKKPVAYLLDLFAEPAGRGRVRLVARRSSLTGQLAGWKIHHRVAVYPSVKDALAAPTLP